MIPAQSIPMEYWNRVPGSKERGWMYADKGAWGETMLGTLCSLDHRAMLGLLNGYPRPKDISALDEGRCKVVRTGRMVQEHVEGDPILRLR